MWPVAPLRMMGPMNTAVDAIAAFLQFAPALFGLVALVAMGAAAVVWFSGAEGEIDDAGCPLVTRGDLAGTARGAMAR